MYKKFWKRALDILLSLIAMPFLLLILLIMIPAIYLNDRGDPFFVSDRLGRDGRIFKMLKLRSMRVHAEDIRNRDGTTYKGRDDARVTAIGRIMRRTGIDELPQIFNVLVGNMSFIGPRPDLPDTIGKLTGALPLPPGAGKPPEGFYEKYYVHRMSVRPGITGYSPVFISPAVSRYEKDMAEAWYADNLTFALDVKVFLKTIDHILTGKHR